MTHDAHDEYEQPQRGFIVKIEGTFCLFLHDTPVLVFIFNWVNF
jgi:hypothetical protein